MPFNGSGVFQRVRNWVADAAAGTKIRADYHDSEDDGFAAGLTNCITRDGQTIITQNIPFNSKRVTGLADPVNAQDAATKAVTDANLAAANAHADAGDTAVSNAKVSKAGDTMTGPLTVNGELVAVQNYLRFGVTGGPGYIIYTGPGAYSLGGAGTIYHTGNFNPGAYQPALGFSPVRQSGGAYQLTNTVYIGWDGAGLRAQVDGTDLGRFFMTNSNPPNAIQNGRLVYAGDVSCTQGGGPGGNMYEPYGGAVVTGWSWSLFDHSISPEYYRLRYMQLFNGSWFTIGYA